MSLSDLEEVDPNQFCICLGSSCFCAVELLSFALGVLTIPFFIFLFSDFETGEETLDSDLVTEQESANAVKRKRMSLEIC
jgi:hypothetical protein